MARSGKAIDPAGSPTVVLGPVSTMYNTGLAANFPNQSGLQYWTDTPSQSSTSTILSLQGPGLVKFLEARFDGSVERKIYIYVDGVCVQEDSIAWYLATNYQKAYIGSRTYQYGEDGQQNRMIDPLGVVFNSSFMILGYNSSLSSPGSWQWRAYWRLTG